MPDPNIAGAAPPRSEISSSLSMRRAPKLWRPMANGRPMMARCTSSKGVSSSASNDASFTFNLGGPISSSGGILDQNILSEFYAGKPKMIATRKLLLAISLASLTGMLLTGTPVAAGGHGGDDTAFCSFYADRAVGQYHAMRKSNPALNPFCYVADSPAWQPDFDNHFGWCMANIGAHFDWMASEDEARSLHLVKNCFAPAPPVVPFLPKSP